MTKPSPKRKAHCGAVGGQGNTRQWGPHVMTDYSTDGQPEQDLIDQAEGMLDESFRTAEQAEAEILAKRLVTADLVARVAETMIELEGQALQAGLDALRTLLAYCPTSERQATAPTLSKLFPRHDELTRFLESCPPPPDAPRFAPLGLSQLLNRPAKHFFVDQVIGPGDIGTAYGPPGSAKTFGIVDFIFAGCLGKTWAMRFDVARPLNMAYCAGEGLGGLPPRFASAAQHYDVDELPGFTFFELVPQLFANQSTDSIAQFVAEWRDRQASGAAPALDILIIDTMHSATVGADENSAQDMGRVLSAAKLAIRELGCAVLLVHHSNKAGTGERGSSALRGAMDVLIEFKTVAGKYAMSCEKLKDAPAWKPQTFSLVELGDSARVWWDEPADNTDGARNQAGEKLLAELQKRPGRKFTAKSLSELIGGGPSATTNALLRLVNNGSVKRVLEDEGKPSSNRNPWVYYFEPDA